MDGIARKHIKDRKFGLGFVMEVRLKKSMKVRQKSTMLGDFSARVNEEDIIDTTIRKFSPPTKHSQMG